MSDAVASQMGKMTLKDSEELSRPTERHVPFLFVPPELLCDILQHCSHPSYRAEKAEFARLSLVSRQFYSVAQEFLYRKIVISVRPSDIDKLELNSYEAIQAMTRDYMLLSAFQTYPRCASLVKILHASFYEIPPSADIGRVFACLLEQLEKLQELWLLDQGGNFWPLDQKNLEVSTITMRTLSLVLSEVHKTTLKVLVVPQLEMQPYTFHPLLTSLSSLETYKGSVAALPNRHEVPQNVVSQLRRLWVTMIPVSSDVTFAFKASTDSLRYLHLVFHKENNYVDLSRFKQLEILVLSIKLIPSVIVGTPEMTPEEGMKMFTDVPKKLISTVLETAESARSIATLRHFSLLTNVHQFLPPHFEKFFLRLPYSISEFSLDSFACHSLPWSIFVANNRRLYPNLKKFYLRRPKESTLDNSADSKVYFQGIDNFEARTGITVEWIADREEDWKYFVGQMFYPGAGKEELIGKENEYAKKQIEAENLSCVVS